MKNRIFLTLLILLSMPSLAFAAAISTPQIVSPDDVTIPMLENWRSTHEDAINSADGGLIQAETITTTQLDANANPENRWNEAFNDFVYTGLLPPTSASLSTTITAGTAYIEGVRVVKDATAHTYTANKLTYIDLSKTGVYTYQEINYGGSVPSVTSNSIRIAKVSTDSSIVGEVEDLRTTDIVLTTTTAVSKIIDLDEDTKVDVEESTDEDIIRFDTGGTEQLIIQDGSVEPTTDDDIDLGSNSKEFKDLYIDGTANIDIASLTTINANATLTINDNSTNDVVDILLDTSTGDGLYINDDLAKAAGKHSLYLDANGATTNADSAVFKILHNNASSTEPAAEIVGSANSILAHLTQNGAQQGLFIDQNGDATYAIDIDYDASSVNSLVGIHMNIANASSGTEFAFKFDGSETDATSGGDTKAGRIVIDVGGATRYIYFYSN